MLKEEEQKRFLLIEENRKSSEKYEEILSEMAVKLENQIRMGNMERKNVKKTKFLI